MKKYRLHLKESLYLNPYRLKKQECFLIFK
eukprot:UN18736